MGNLLDFDDSPASSVPKQPVKTRDLLSDLADITGSNPGISPSGEPSVQDHPFYMSHTDRFSST